jgi:hypothetical protein
MSCNHFTWLARGSGDQAAPALHRSRPISHHLALRHIDLVLKRVLERQLNGTIVTDRPGDLAEVRVGHTAVGRSVVCDVEHVK